MKYLVLVWAGLGRKPIRTTLTIVCIVIAFLLFGTLQSINLGMNAVYQNLNVDRLFVENKINVGDGLPISYLDRIRAVPGVKAVTHWSFLSAYYRDSRNSVPAYATDLAGQFAVYPKLALPSDHYQSMLRTKNGVVVGKSSAEKYGWKVGDKISLTSALWTQKSGGNSYELDVVGVFDGSMYGERMGWPSVYVNYDYFDQARAFMNGMVHFYIVSVEDPRKGGEIAGKIDALFANSANETRTQSEQAWGQNLMKQVADIGTIVNFIVGAVMFTLLFLTGNTMAQSVRERVPELAVLKTLGFSDKKILTLVILESVALCTVSALFGLLMAVLIFKTMQSLFGVVTLEMAVVWNGVAIAVLLALLSGVPPAWRAVRINTIDALAGR